MSLDNIPLGTIIALVGIVLIALGYITDDLSIDEAFKNLAYVGGTATGVGIMRTHAGKGVRK